MLMCPFVALRNTSRKKSRELGFTHRTLVQVLGAYIAHLVLTDVSNAFLTQSFKAKPDGKGSQGMSAFVDIFAYLQISIKSFLSSICPSACVKYLKNKCKGFREIPY